MDRALQGTAYDANAPRALSTVPRYTRHALSGIRLKTWRSSLLLLPACLYFLFKHGEALFLDPLTVLIHEAGHLCFFFFGDLLHAAGGTLMQILLPVTLAWHFWQYRSREGIQVSLLWLGQNLLAISVYAADARMQGLDVLLGRQHDWSYLLGRLGLLEYDQAVAFACCFFAILSFLALLALPRFMKTA